MINSMTASDSSIRSLDRPGVMRTLAVVQLIVLLPLYFYLPLWITLVSVATLAWAFFTEQRQWSNLPRWLIVGLAVGLVALVYFSMGRVTGRSGGAALIAAMYGLKLLESRTYRDANLILCLGFFVAVISFLYNQSWYMAVYLLVVTFAILGGLMVLNSLTGIGGLRNGVKLSGGILLQAIPLMVLMFLLFPRFSGPLWSYSSGREAGTGISNIMSPGDISELHLFDDVAFRVRFDGDVPSLSSLYWRGLVFAKFDGFSWQPDSLGDSTGQTLDTDGTTTQYTVFLEPHQHDWLFVLDFPIQGPEKGRMLEDFTWRADRKITSAKLYSATSALAYRTTTPLSDSAREHYLELPRSGNDRSRQWAQETRARYASDEDYLRAVLGTIHQQPYFYTLTPETLDEEIIDSFWFDTREGFCEHYASAFVFMMRAAGIPSRVVAGYQGGELNPYNRYWIVRQSDAHAWTEVWLPDRGWWRVDPTAAIAPERVDDSLLNEFGQRDSFFGDFSADDYTGLDATLFDELGYLLDAIETSWNDWVLGYSSSKQWSFLENFGITGRNAMNLAALMMVVVAVVLAIYSLRILRRRRHPDRIIGLMTALNRKLVRKGVEPLDGETQASFLRRVAREHPGLKSTLVRIAGLYEAIRFQATKRDLDSTSLNKGKELLAARTRPAKRESTDANETSAELARLIQQLKV